MMETISKQPAAKNTTIISTFIKPLLAPLGANNSLRKPPGPTSCTAQTIQQAKNTRAMASVKLRSAFAPQERPIDHENIGGLMSPSNRADAGDEAHPIGGQDENEHSG